MTSGPWSRGARPALRRISPMRVRSADRDARSRRWRSNRRTARIGRWIAARSTATKSSPRRSSREHANANLTDRRFRTAVKRRLTRLSSACCLADAAAAFRIEARLRAKSCSRTSIRWPYSALGRPRPALRDVSAPSRESTPSSDSTNLMADGFSQAVACSRSTQAGRSYSATDPAGPPRASTSGMQKMHQDDADPGWRTASMASRPSPAPGTISRSDPAHRMRTAAIARTMAIVKS